MPNDRQHRRKRGLMSPDTSHEPSLWGRIKSANLLRYAGVIGLALAVSGCAYDGVYYRGHSTSHYGYYHPAPVYRHYSPRPNWQQRARLRQLQRRHYEMRKIE